MFDSGVGASDPGVIGKYIGGPTIFLDQKGAWTLDVGSIKTTFPVSGCHDRKPEATFGIGLNYSWYRKR